MPLKVFFETFGCAANTASAETMKSIIKSSGYSIVYKETESDVYICNSCTVKYTTEQKILHRIRHFGEMKKYVIVAGCMPEVQLDRILNENPNVLIVGVNAPTKVFDALKKVEEIIEMKSETGAQTNAHTEAHANMYETVDSKTGHGNYVFDLKHPEGYLNLPKARYNENIHICQISTGCSFSCSYCIVRHARGKLVSFSPEEIINDIKKSLDDGCKEIWLTSQDDSQYGTDFKFGDKNYGLKLPELLKMICEIDGEFKIRIGMMNPFSVLPILNDLINSFKNPKIFKLLHLPIQSASEDVLKNMNRNHKMEDVEKIINSFRKEFPDIDFFTDIIVGFPGETDEDFEKTKEWIKKLKPDKVNISRYSPRPKTKAFDMRKLDSRIVKKRSVELTEIVDEIKLESKEKMIGKSVNVFVSKYAKQKGVLARTENYRPVIIKDTKLKPGDKTTVKITEATPGYFIGKEI